MNIVLTNDDGCHAPGLVAAYRALNGLGTVHVVAPCNERSACSHTITLHRPVVVEQRQHEIFGGFFSVDGTPADCVRLAFAELLKVRIDLVVSGINRGANAGVDVFYSGTVAGAREAAILRIPAIAFSQAVRAEYDIDWEQTARAAAHLLPKLISEPVDAGFWNVNFPAPIPESFTDQVRHVPVATHAAPLRFERHHPENDDAVHFTYGASYWLRDERGPSDYTTIRDGGIAVSAVPLVGVMPEAS